MIHAHGRVPARTRVIRFLAVAALAPLVALVGATPSYAAIVGGTADQLASASESNGSPITGAWETKPPIGTASGVGNSAVAGFPTDGSTFAVMTTGDINSADKANNSEATSGHQGGLAVRGFSERDVSTLRLNFVVGAGQNCVRFDFRFFSEEFKEFQDREYVDAFIAEVDTQTWTTDDKSQLTVTNNMAFDEDGDPITVASKVGAEMAPSPSGVTYDGATAILTASQSVQVGNHVLYLSIFDQGDDIYDSAVFVDNLVVGHAADPAKQCVKGAAPKSTLDLLPPTAAKTVGGTHTVNATVKAIGGGPISGEPVLFTVTRGATAVTSGTSNTNAQGVASFTYSGASPGEDVITACHDANGDHDCDFGEPSATVKATWTAAAPTTSPPSGHAGLPVTGTPVGLIAGVGAGAVVLGIAGYVLIRRRRVRFVAE